MISTYGARLTIARKHPWSWKPRRSGTRGPLGWTLILICGWFCLVLEKKVSYVDEED